MRVDGRAIAQSILDDLKNRRENLKKKGVTPHLVIILIGNDPASGAYVQQKILKANEIGVKVTLVNYESRITNQELITTIEQWNNDNNVHGIIVQRPLPKHIDSEQIAQAVDPKKDVDGFHPESKLEMPLSIAVLRILEHIFSSSKKSSHNFINWLKEKSIVIIGKGEAGGKPIINKLRTLGVQPLIIDSKTTNPEVIIKKADIIISAVGKPNIVRSEIIKKGTILISVGLYKGGDEKLHGDYNEEKIKDIASFYTPTPGGVGPVNVACLLENLVIAAETPN
ncbi:MAG: bifunctional 5,10-methylenetetrahydrofolate dehydrogenase/5,10-methenyltetrahydrofolate cyclohydrolase [Candidatus Levybacteria bacterium]|nr:bifunctional 5,10-methylenetetrahydrofolate dehydrogenase/5,10-methenyltetrahydrofolate cyclohydrolase [Candidatus Levybacteria bacterium]